MNWLLLKIWHVVETVVLSLFQNVVWLGQESGKYNSFWNFINPHRLGVWWSHYFTCEIVFLKNIQPDVYTIFNNTDRNIHLVYLFNV